jgi:hypothetical protein
MTSRMHLKTQTRWERSVCAEGPVGPKLVLDQMAASVPKIMDEPYLDLRNRKTKRKSKLHTEGLPNSWGVHLILIDSHSVSWVTFVQA